MATVTRGTEDEFVARIKQVLDEYERAHPGAAAALYRQNSGSIRIRIVDDRFAGFSKAKRHDEVWDFIASRLDDDTIQEVAILLLLAPREQGASIMNAEFDDPLPSSF